MPQLLVSVVIAARNAERTIARAVSSALRQPEVAEVVIVDDASSDGTGVAALSADDGSARLSLVALDVNRGPAPARNLAIERSSAPFIAILDADDFYLEGRFRNLFAADGWDIAADNIMFVEEGAAISPPRTVPALYAAHRRLELEEFIDGNISRRGMHRGELGFLKPVVSRSFIDGAGLRYREELRLGEDYEFYARAMIGGARFAVTRACGYVATVRRGSLSGSHRTEDLRRLAEADRALLQTGGLPEGVVAALRRHERHVRDRYRLRRFLDRKAEAGMVPALAFAFSDAGDPLTIVRGVAADKIRAVSRRVVPAFARQEPPPVRFLMPPQHQAPR